MRNTLAMNEVNEYTGGLIGKPYFKLQDVLDKIKTDPEQICVSNEYQKGKYQYLIYKSYLHLANDLVKAYDEKKI